jgi:hypothetical protein
MRRPPPRHHGVGLLSRAANLRTLARAFSAEGLPCWACRIWIRRVQKGLNEECLLARYNSAPRLLFKCANVDSRPLCIQAEAMLATARTGRRTTASRRASDRRTLYQTTSFGTPVKGPKGARRIKRLRLPWRHPFDTEQHSVVRCQLSSQTERINVGNCPRAAGMRQRFLSSVLR